MVLEVGIEVTSLEGSKGAFATVIIRSDQIRSVAQSCLTLCDPIDTYIM